MRVHELAKKLGINSKQLLAQLRQSGLQVSNHMSVLPPETIEHYLQVATAIKNKPKTTAAPARGKGKAKSAPGRGKAAAPSREKEKDKEPARARSAAPDRLVEISEGVTLQELAGQMKLPGSRLIKWLMSKGHLVTLNQVLEVELARQLVEAFGFEPRLSLLEESGEEELEREDEANLVPRPPVVTIMGHVDHGKTLLLDAIRSSNLVSREAGGITQHIGAYKVELEHGQVTFLDTPGHEAFTAMRARGARVTDIVVLVVAADDGVMPQTVEAIHHAREAGVPIVVAVNKIDKPEANPERVRQELVKHELVPEDWGGKTIFVDVSAKRKQGLEELLEMLLLEAEMLELKANPRRRARGLIIEAKLDRGRGAVATVLVQNGTLRAGDPFVCGLHYGRVRAMFDEKGRRLQEAPPSTPVEVLGFSGVPQAGDSFAVLESERKAHQVAQLRQQKNREKTLSKRSSRISLEDLHSRIEEGAVQELKLVIKADVQGSVEAISDSLAKLSTDKVQLRTIHGAVGAISEMDVMLASASNAIIIGFNVRPQPKAAQLAADDGVDVRLYTIIYDLLADVKAAMQGMLAPVYREKLLGRAETKEVFRISKVGAIAGSLVQEGKMVRNANARLLRDNVVIYEGSIETLKRFKEDVREVASGYECGIKLAGYNDIKQGDIIEAFVQEQVQAQL